MSLDTISNVEFGLNGTANARPTAPSQGRHWSLHMVFSVTVRRQQGEVESDPCLGSDDKHHSPTTQPHDWDCYFKSWFVCLTGELRQHSLTRGRESRKGEKAFYTDAEQSVGRGWDQRSKVRIDEEGALRWDFSAWCEKQPFHSAAQWLEQAFRRPLSTCALLWTGRRIQPAWRC